MFNSIRNFFSSSSDEKRFLLLSSRRMRAKQAKADRAIVRHLATALDGLQATCLAWVNSPSSTSSTVIHDIFFSRVMQGLAGGVAEVADYLTERADRKRKDEGVKTDAERKAAHVARAVGSVHMMYVDGLMTEGKRVSLVVDAAIASDIAVAIHKFCMSDVEIRDCSEPGKSVLVVHDASNGGKDDESVH